MVTFKSVTQDKPIQGLPSVGSPQATPQSEADHQPSPRLSNTPIKNDPKALGGDSAKIDVSRIIEDAKNGSGSVRLQQEQGPVLTGFAWYDNGQNAQQYRKVNANMEQSIFVKKNSDGTIATNQYPDANPLSDDTFEDAAVQYHLDQGKAPEALLVVDLGCGSGRALKRLKDKFEGIAVKGLDGSKEQLKQAQVTGLTTEELTRTDLTQTLPLSSDSVDTISCNSVIQYFQPEQLNQVLSEMARVIKPETGVASLMFKTTINDEYSKAPVKQQFFDKSYQTNREFLLWSTDSVKEIARTHGLAVATNVNEQGDNLFDLNHIQESRGIDYANVVFYKPTPLNTID